MTLNLAFPNSIQGNAGCQSATHALHRTDKGRRVRVLGAVAALLRVHQLLPFRRHQVTRGDQRAPGPDRIRRSADQVVDSPVVRHRLNNDLELLVGAFIQNALNLRLNLAFHTWLRSLGQPIALGRACRSDGISLRQTTHRTRPGSMVCVPRRAGTSLSTQNGDGLETK
jgi:hypothetical protein